MIQKAFMILWGQHNRHQWVSMIHRRFGSYPSLGWTECLNSFRPPCCSLSSGSISWRKHSIWGLSVYVWRRRWQPTPLLLPGIIPWMEEPGRLQSVGSRRVRHNWATLLSLFTFMHWRRKWQPTPVFLPGESQGQGSLVGCRLWGRTESDTTEAA